MQNKWGTYSGIISGVIIMLIYSLDLRSDYYYLFSKKDAIAALIDISGDKHTHPYILHMKYFNEYENKVVSCAKRVDDYYGDKISQSKPANILIYYTKESPFAIYIPDYRKKTIAIVVVRILIFTVVTLFIVFNLVSLFKRKVSQE